LQAKAIRSLESGVQEAKRAVLQAQRCGKVKRTEELWWSGGN
jgi:hypothetical protein